MAPAAVVEDEARAGAEEEVGLAPDAGDERDVRGVEERLEGGGGGLVALFGVWVVSLRCSYERGGGLRGGLQSPDSRRNQWRSRRGG